MTKITTKGQVTIPKRLRDHLGLKPGSSVEFELAADGRVFLRMRQRVPESRFARLRGSAKPGTTDEVMALTRGEG
jgi:AbrB family looped-hinge helix DNA binding protein